MDTSYSIDTIHTNTVISNRVTLDKVFKTVNIHEYTSISRVLREALSTASVCTVFKRYRA